MATSLARIYQERKKKLAEIGKQVNPYPARTRYPGLVAEARQKLGKEAQVVGRLMGWRAHGGSIFADLKDASGKIQLFFSRGDLGEKKYSFLKLVDVGDFLAVKGEVFKTQRGEITIRVKDFQFLAKSLRPLPDKWKGLKDIELRSRRRYLDLLVNPSSREVFLKRTQIITALRKILNGKGFIEVETPTLQPLYGGASARPFVTHHNALDINLYLKISDELYLKRLVVGGFDQVYEIDHDFRNEGVDKSHNPEFTMMECYWAYADYEKMMALTEEIYAGVAKSVLGTTKITYQKKEIDLKPPWRRMTMFAAIKKYLGWDPEKIGDKELREMLKEKGVEMPGGFNRGLAIAALFEEVEEKLIQPTFITDFPKETTMLCKPREDKPQLIERFEPYIAGFEVGNAYSELNDPLLQRQFFEEQVKAAAAGDEEAPPLDEDFIEAMEYGMPPMGGLGLGVDRMVMLLTGQENIRDVILFPTLRPKGSND